MKKVEDRRLRIEERVVCSILDPQSSILGYLTLPRALLRLS
jgi:hypothetical protein